MLILSLETSTHVCSVALHRAGNLLACVEILIDKSHAEKITLLIEEVCIKAEVSLANIDAIAISKGPGSYTGLRIASSTAKGLCFALGKPFIAIDTLQSIALQVVKLENLDLQLVDNVAIVPMIDARRMEVFTANYDAHAIRISDFDAKIIDENSYRELLETKKLIFCGNGADKCQTTILHPNAKFIDGIYPKATFIGYLATKKYLKNDFEDVVNFEPFYLKEFYMKTAMPPV
ncbi:MAG: tRNA (adenosine(37)-N6)-threonylcarbamoyltransferase complex dimerization subunit type 1 TsaB [Cytophagales bacterium]